MKGSLSNFARFQVKAKEHLESRRAQFMCPKASTNAQFV